MEISWNVDWITMTTKLAPTGIVQQEQGISAAKMIANEVAHQLGLGTLYTDSVRSDRFYRYIFDYTDPGIRISVAEDTEVQGIRVEFTGKGLQQLWSLAYLTHAARQNGYKITRFDVSIDVMNSGITVASIIDEYLATHGDARKRTVKSVLSPTGDTLYIGSRTSEKMLRIYDKGKEQRTTLDWIRLEIEVKGLPANAWYESAAESPLMLVPTMLAMLDLPEHPIAVELNRLMEFDEGLPAIPLKQHSSREAWLRTQVMSSFQKLLVDDPAAANRVMNDFLGSMGLPPIDTTE